MGRTAVYIDCQVLQTDAWDRGMGRYTTSLLGALCKNAKNITFHFIFSKHLPLKGEVTKALTAICPGATTVQLDLRLTHKTSYKEPAAYNKAVLQTYVKQQPRQDRHIFLIPSLFQEPVASIFPEDVEKWLIYYDAIPLLYYQRYVHAIGYENYLERHAVLFDADSIYTISQTVANDLAVYYGLESDDRRKIINIDGACIDGMFEQSRKPAFSVPERYILFPTSNDIRKNNNAAIKAFIQFCGLAGQEYKLIITSTFDKGSKAELERIAQNCIFTGNLSDAELAWLYEHAEAVLFTSEYEGLGLPVLEAVKMGKKVACSDIPVFREISEEAFYYFDPLDTGSIAYMLKQAVDGEGWERKKKHYARINKRYTWQRTASIVHKELARQSHIRPHAKKPKIAILAPIPDGYSAIGKVVQELHAAAAQYFDIDYYFEDRKQKESLKIRPNFLPYLTNTYEVADFNAARYRDYDAVIYHIGNSEYHFRTILNALYLPGITIFHDTILRDAFDEMVYLGYIYLSRLQAELELDAMTGSKQTACLTSLANNQLAGIAHSAYAKKAIGPILMSKVPIVTAALPVTVPAQQRLLTREKVYVGLAGILSGRKGIETIKQLALDPAFSDRVIFHVFGFSMVDPEAIEELRHIGNVRLETDLTDLEYQTKLSNLDILVNFRSDYRGETSLTVLEAMRYGCVVIVNGGLGWFAELPDDTVVKIDNQDDVVATVHKLVGDASRRSAIGSAARNYALSHHSPDAYAKAILALVRQAGSVVNSDKAVIMKQAGTASEAVSYLQGLQKDKTSDTE